MTGAVNAINQWAVPIFGVLFVALIVYVVLRFVGRFLTPRILKRMRVSGDDPRTRLLTDDKAPNAGGFYSSGEFDLAMLDALPGRVAEIGRTCVDADYRGGAVIATLWQGIASYVTPHGFDYLFGCASIGLEDGGAQAHAILQQIRGKYLSPEYQRVRPYYPLPAVDGTLAAKVRMPPLLKAYVSLGAKACGEAYWDREFNCADVFMLLNVSDLNPRYARHFLERSAGNAQMLSAGHA